MCGTGPRVSLATTVFGDLCGDVAWIGQQPSVIGLIVTGGG